MLVLSRQRDQSIIMREDGTIIIQVVDIRGDKVRLSVKAPCTTTVYRKEVFLKIVQELVKRGTVKRREDITDEILFRYHVEKYLTDQGILQPGERPTEAQVQEYINKCKDGRLILARDRDETLQIGCDIEVTVVDIRGEKMRLGISAPPHVPVHRLEVWERIRREKQEYGATGDDVKVQSLARRKDDGQP